MCNSKKKEIINDIKNFVNTYQMYIDNDAPNYSNLQYMGEQFKKDNMRNEEICDYCKQNISFLAKSINLQNFFNFVQIIFINQQVNKVELINQFEIDYMYAMVMKYSCSDELFKYDEYGEVLHLFISLIRILYFFEVNSLNKDFQSLKVSNYYRTRRFINNSTRFEIDKELIEKFKKINSSVCMKKISDWLEHIPTIVMERRNDFIKGEISLEEIFSFQLGDSQFIRELSLSEIELILKTFCIDFSEIKNYSDDDLYLVNRISNKFLVRNGNHINIINIGQLADNYISNFYELFNQMDNQRYKENFYNIRDKFLDEHVAKLLSSHFGKNRVFRNNNWSMNGNTGENDSLVIIDSVALIFEAKAGQINEGVKKGILKNIHQWNQKNIEYGIKQGANFKDFLNNNLGKKIQLKRQGGTLNYIDLTGVKQIYHFVVILDATPIQSIQSELQNENKNIVPVFTLYNLSDILKNLSFISEKVDYFIKRCAIENTCRYIGEEEDFISLYHINGLNTKDFYENMDFNSVKVISFDIDKLTIEGKGLTNLWKSYLEFIESSQSPQWLQSAISMLEVPPIVQKQILRDIKKENELYLKDNIEVRKKLIYVKRLNKQTIEEKDVKNLNITIPSNEAIKNILVILFDQNMNQMYAFCHLIE